MADCDLCGKGPIVGTNEIEGARMNVCAACSSHGKMLKRTGGTGAPDPWTIKRSRPRTEAPVSEAQVRPDLAAVLRKARERSGMTQEQFAARLGVKLSAYHHYESGSGMPDNDVAHRMERVLGTPLVGVIRTEKREPATPSVPKGEPARGVTIGDLLRRT